MKIVAEKKKDKEEKQKKTKTVSLEKLDLIEFVLHENEIKDVNGERRTTYHTIYAAL